jgi:hypothetical protein
LDQEEQLTSIKRPRSNVCNYEEKGKIRTIYCEEKGVQDGEPSHPPPPPVATLGPGAADFGENSQLVSFGGFWRVLTDFGEFCGFLQILADYPKTCTYFNNLKLII